MTRASLVLISLMLIVLGGCSKEPKEAPQAQPVQGQTAQPAQPAPPEAVPAQPEPAPAEAAQPLRKSQAARTTRTRATAPKEAQMNAEPAPAPVEAPAAPPVRSYVPATPPPPPQPRYALIPAGSTIVVRLQDPLDTAVNQAGDGFRALLDRDLVVEGNVVVPRGTVLQGKVSHAARAGRVQGRALMSLELTNMKASDGTYPIQTNVLSFEAESTKKQDAAKVGIGAGLGAVIGAIAGGGKGAAIGAAVGGGAGGATVAATRGKELKFDPEHMFTFTLQRDLQVRLQ